MTCQWHKNYIEDVVVVIGRVSSMGSQLGHKHLIGENTKQIGQKPNLKNRHKA
jgi:hypothetical protein